MELKFYWIIFLYKSSKFRFSHSLTFLAVLLKIYKLLKIVMEKRWKCHDKHVRTESMYNRVQNKYVLKEKTREERRVQDNNRNKRVRAEIDYNRVQNEYLLAKYGAIAEEFSQFYDVLREKYPTKYIYKGSKRFRIWVLGEIEKYDNQKNDEERNADNDVSEAAVGVDNVSNVPYVPEAAVDINTVIEEVGLGDVINDEVNIDDIIEEFGVADVVNDPVGANVVNDPVGANVVVQQHPLENIIANGLPEELHELDNLIGDIIADIENQCDEGIFLSPSHEVEVDPLYYDAEIEGLDDIDIDLPYDLLEAELNIELENF